MPEEFKGFGKIPRLIKDVLVTEKLDGTNAQIYITEDGDFLTGSRNKYITPDDDNYGFSRWAHENKDELMKLGVGRHFGEWWGQGIQRGYGLKEKRFSLFNVEKWSDPEERPECCDVVPLLYKGVFDQQKIDFALYKMRHYGSLAVPDYMSPEGIIIYHKAAGALFKKTINDNHKSN